MKRKLAPQMSASAPRRVTSTRLIGFCMVRSILSDYSCPHRSIGRSAKTAGSLRRLAGKCGKRLGEPPDHDLRVSRKERPVGAPYHRAGAFDVVVQCEERMIFDSRVP